MFEKVEAAYTVYFVLIDTHQKSTSRQRLSFLSEGSLWYQAGYWLSRTLLK